MPPVASQQTNVFAWHSLPLSRWYKVMASFCCVPSPLAPSASPCPPAYRMKMPKHKPVSSSSLACTCWAAELLVNISTTSLSTPCISPDQKAYGTGCAVSKSPTVDRWRRERHAIMMRLLSVRVLGLAPHRVLPWACI